MPYSLPRVTRRGFLLSVAGAVAARRLIVIPAPPPPAPVGLAALLAELPPGCTVGGIDAASFAFWRARSIDAPGVSL